MAEENDPITKQTDPNQNEPAPQGAEPDWKALARKWEARAKASNEQLKELEELKAKAAKLDELEDAKKSELERVSEQASAAQKAASEWQTKYEQLEAQRKHDADVRQAAQAYGVDADVLIRMGGDVEENAKFLQAREAARPKFGDMHDGGDHQTTATLESELEGAKNEAERIRIRAKYNAQRRNKQ